MSSKRNNKRKPEYKPKPQPLGIDGQPGVTANNQKPSFFEMLQRFLPHTQEDEMTKLRRIMIFVVALVVIEFSVIAVVFSANPPVLQNKNAGQSTPIDSNGSACNSSRSSALNTQSPSASLQNSPSPQNSTSTTDASGNLQAAPQGAQCM
jgi:hypothetical protein